MSDKMRWRYGDTNHVVAAVGSSTEIEIGDLLWQDTNQAKPASDQADQGSDEDNQEAFTDSFLGVAMQRSRSGDTDPIRVATTGVFEFELEYLAALELGDLIGPRASDREGGGTILDNQRVEKVTESKYAVGRCSKRGTALTSVLVDIRSTVMTGGV